MTNPSTERDVTNASAIGKIFCANCIHCKLVPAPAGQGRYYLRVRCAEGKWLKKSGEEKIYKYFTVAQRSIPHCQSYVDMGEGPEFLRDLRTSLPGVDEIYQVPQGDNT
ncbi:MAG: hypothetical protein A2087_02885 [Spirochaetes bacterium GWD1_61_31]|nr:MAG: hypothetical protein A2Y37_03780 [Spirochaetes bacterium GWB1_60_80]OHD28599.1 MAG: hypothetical protein A2004_06045 [Spirochaetes bacterium GWC1_61_12]OHD37610.1 MAG: hypothetical protein A2087_02885 [Spirochaetes bacterium GWD1_61_31]OHD44334.1 MAG: hypothetical protein A2Y35_09440 [Spirochaetes bacterium GWE1_60_18]OHD61022.1 MAG: hypothetical protein A2Y32_05045 [Spirochaetes bacterium GWF1_60_12]HAP44766.1 hypothetical protein [Spirochaetaceae bacterium]